jgi:hypothetical protein
MTEQNLQRGVFAILVIATVTLVGVLAVGVVQGQLRGAPDSGIAGRFAGAASSSELFTADQDHGLLVLANDARRLLTVSVPTGDVQSATDLPGRAVTITPTPGGVSVWVSFENRPEIEVYSTTDLTHQATVLPAGGSGSIPATLTFSENGDTLFVTWREEARVSIYRHEMRELTLMREITSADAAETTGRVIRNRRATRLYRFEEDGNLATFFAQNGQRLQSIGIPGDGIQSAVPPVFAADYTVAWAVSETGDLIGIDVTTETAHVHQMGFEAAPDFQPVMIGEEPWALVVRADRRGVHRIDLADSENPSASATVDLASVGVDGRIVSAIPAGNGAALLLTDGGHLVTVDGSTLSVVEATDIRDQAEPIQPIQAVAWSIEEDGNFACF